jgi:hypothetical protein
VRSGNDNESTSGRPARLTGHRRDRNRASGDRGGVAPHSPIVQLSTSAFAAVSRTPWLSAIGNSGATSARAPARELRWHYQSCVTQPEFSDTFGQFVGLRKAATSETSPYTRHLIARGQPVRGTLAFQVKPARIPVTMWPKRVRVSRRIGARPTDCPAQTGDILVSHLVGTTARRLWESPRPPNVSSERILTNSADLSVDYVSHARGERTLNVRI